MLRLKSNDIFVCMLTFILYSGCRLTSLLSLYYSDYLFKLLLIGDSGVGKSCLLLRFAVSRLSPCCLGLRFSLPFPVSNKEGVFAIADALVQDPSAF